MASSYHPGKFNVTTSGYCYIWEFIVGESNQAEFEIVYGSEGAWVELFSQGDGYIGSELVKDIHRNGRYLTIDRWSSRERYERFRKEFDDQFKRLDNECERLTLSETSLGEFSISGLTC